MCSPPRVHVLQHASVLLVRRRVVPWRPTFLRIIFDDSKIMKRRRKEEEEEEENLMGIYKITRMLTMMRMIRLKKKMKQKKRNTL